MDELEDVPLLDACIKEALRLNTPIPLTGRISTQHTEFGGVSIPKGTEVIIIHYTITKRIISNSNHRL